MSAMLESLLDNERRLRCRVNDAAMATGRPIIVSQPKSFLVWRASELLRHAVPTRSDRSKSALMATDERW